MLPNRILVGSVALTLLISSLLSAGAGGVDADPASAKAREMLDAADGIVRAKSVAGQVEAAAKLAGVPLEPVALPGAGDPAALLLGAIADAQRLQAAALARMGPEDWQKVIEGGAAGVEAYDHRSPSGRAHPAVRADKLEAARAGVQAIDVDQVQLWQATYTLAVALDEAAAMVREGRTGDLVSGTYSLAAGGLVAIDLGPAPCNTVYNTWYVLIIDTCGDDEYDAPAGGAAVVVAAGPPIVVQANPISVVLDTDGDDTVLPDGVGGVGGFLPAQAAGTNGGIALTLDTTGDEARTPGPDPFDPRMGAYGGLIGGAGTNVGIGVLVDVAGNDDNRVQGLGIPGKWGGGFTGGVGIYADFQGADTYGGDEFEMGSGWFGGVGIHVDLGDEADFYYDFSTFAEGSGGDGGLGILLNEGGDDQYVTASPFEQGSGTTGGVGVLLDLKGSDTYDAPNCFSQGYGNLGIGLLIDPSGLWDTYINPCPPANNAIRPNGALGLAVDV